MVSYYCNCVNWPKNDVDVPGGLCDMIDEGRQITRRTFLKHINRKHLERLSSCLGYSNHPSRGLTMNHDWHVGYYKSKLHDRRVYYFTHSGIEYVFK